MKHLILYVGDSFDEDGVRNSRANFVHPRGNDAEQEFAFMEAWDCRNRRH